MIDRHAYLDRLLDETRMHVRRFVVVGETERDAIALWNAHTYVYDLGRATPYLNPYSPEPGSGKTTLLELLAQTARDAIEADGLSEAALFRLINLRRPTLLVDEVDSIFSKKNSDSTEGIRQVLNSGYRKGRHVCSGGTSRCSRLVDFVANAVLAARRMRSTRFELPGVCSPKSAAQYPAAAGNERRCAR